MLARALVARRVPADWSAAAAAHTFELAIAHRVDRLLAAALVADSASAPDVEREPFRQLLREAAATELAIVRSVTALLAAADDAGVQPVLFKGEAMAWLLYPASHLRPRTDTDVLVRPTDREAMVGVMRRSGYVEVPDAGGSLTNFQSHWTRIDAAGVHAVDLHWRLFNAEPFAHVLDPDEISRASIPVVALGPAARAASYEHQLIASATHRVAHHYDSPSLLWLYDLHLLVGALGNEGVAPAARLAAPRGGGPIPCRGLPPSV